MQEDDQGKAQQACDEDLGMVEGERAECPERGDESGWVVQSNGLDGAFSIRELRVGKAIRDGLQRIR